jgi:predicted lipid-binding transport protein (Tim44 family)
MSFSFVLLVEGPYPVKILSMPFDKLMLVYVIVTAIAAIAAVVTLLTIRGQLQVTRNQLKQMEEAGKQTEALINQASAQSTALLVAARAAESNAEAAHAQVVQFRAVAEAAEKSAKAAVRNTEALVNSDVHGFSPRFSQILQVLIPMLKSLFLIR